MKKKLIRHNVFETNSSSSHSVSIADSTKEFILETIYPDSEGTIYVDGDGYGWGYFKHNDAVTKLSYAAQQFNGDNFRLEMLTDLVKEQTGAENIVYRLEHGYVDHQSSDILRDMTAEELSNFIFNKNSWLFGGNDNLQPDPEFYIVPTYDKDGVKPPHFKYALKIEGIRETLRYLDYPSSDDISDSLDSLFDYKSLTTDGRIISNNYMTYRERDNYFTLWSGWFNLPTIDMENKTILFDKGLHRAVSDIVTKRYPDNTSFENRAEITKELVNDPKSPYVKYLKFEIVEL